MIRTYSAPDKQKVIELVRLNTPQYFAETEQADLDHYLDHEIEDYFVYEADGNILGAGGINYILENHEARISWDIVHPEFHGQGIGSQLLQHRIDRIHAIPEVQLISVRTSQLTSGFYAKHGFTLEHTQSDFWAPGIDLHHMMLSINK